MCRNLVLLRAGDAPLLGSWRRDIPDEARNWDVLVSYYGDRVHGPDPAGITPHEYVHVQRGTTKWPAVLALHQAGLLPDFDYVWIPDDDIATSWSAVNRLFDLCRQYALQLAQPALDEHSHVSHQITRRVPGLRLRYTSFVEVMAPVFHRLAFAACAGSFVLSRSGWGLDAIWPLLVDAPGAMAVIDEIAVCHTRPMGTTYDREAAAAEMREVMARFGQDTLRREVYAAVPLERASLPAVDCL